MAGDDDLYQRLGNPEIKTMPCIESSQVDVSELTGLIILILNIFGGTLGTFLSVFVDRKGINCTAFCVCILQGMLIPFFLIGWVWAIWHGFCIYRVAVAKERLGNLVN